MMSDSDQLDDILAQTAWLRRLARRLVADEAEQDDVVQRAWVEVLRAQNRPQAVRPWMFGILRNVVRMRLRSDHRRLRREAAEPLVAPPPVSPEELVQRVEVERRVATEVLQIDEPYRSTLLMRYYEELEPKEIAQRLGIPSSTVRGRLKEGLDRLRVRLDREFGGDRRRWGLALIPTAAVTHGKANGIAASIGAAFATNLLVKVLASALCVALMAWAGSRLWLTRAASTEIARMSPGTPWHGATGHHAVDGNAATVEGIKIPLWFGQRGAPVRRIAGRVTVRGAPFAGATVELASALTDAGVLPVTTQQTSSDGSFDFGSQAPARYSIAASAPQHSPAVLELDTRDLATRADGLELRIGGCDLSIFGHVNDSSGGPIAVARVCFAPPRAACVVTDETGSYEMCLSPRQSAVEIGAKGYATVDERVYFSGRRTQRDFLLTPEATVIGRAVRAEDGVAIAGAEITVVGVGQKTPHWPASISTVSDSEGRFAVTGLSPGRIRLGAMANGALSREWLELNVEAGRVTGEVLLRLAPVGRVSGSVTDGENPVSGAVVVAGDAGPAVSDAVTQSDGSFVLENVPRGTQILRVVAYDVREPRLVVIDRDNIPGVRLVVVPMGSIAGRITRAGQPLAGEVNDGRNTVALAGDDGHYVVRGLRPGKYHLYAYSPMLGASGLSPDVTLTAGEQRTGVDIDMQCAGSISGTIVETSGVPAAGVFVRFEAQHQRDGGDDVTAPDGSFRVATLIGSDDYRPVVRPARNSLQKFVGGDDDFPTVHVADGDAQVTGVRLVIKRAHLPIAGRVVDDEGQPLADVRVVADRVDGDEVAVANVWNDTPAAISTSDGSFRIDNLDTGLYRLDARGADGSEATLQPIAAGALGAVLKLQSAGGIDGTLVGFSARPIVRASRQQVVAVPHYANGSGDAFSLRGLPPGEYVVSAIGAGGDAISVVVEPGRIASVTLHNRGVASIKGHVFDWRSGAPVAGLRCEPGVRSTSGLPSWDPNNVAFSDLDGRFTLQGIAAGANAVECKTDSIFVLPGMVAVSLTEGQAGSAEVPVLEQNQQGSPGMLGAKLDPLAFLIARIILVQPGSPADRAGLRVGDIIASVDGKPVTNLTPYSVGSLIVDRGPGIEARLGILRNGAASNVSVILGPPIVY